MRYSEDEIFQYTQILNDYGRGLIGGMQSPCSNFEEYLGQYVCIDCGRLCGHILGKYDVNDSDRLHYSKKSVYHRKYYFEKKVNIISSNIGLSDEEKCKLYEKLIEINDSHWKVINTKYNRKRMINTNFIIRKVLKEMGCEKYKMIVNKISPKILEIYNNWWRSYKLLC